MAEKTPKGKEATGSMWQHAMDFISGGKVAKDRKEDPSEQHYRREEEEDPEDFGKQTKPIGSMSKAPMHETEHMAALGDSHPESSASGEPLHPKLQALASLLKEDDEDESSPKGAGYMGMKSGSKV
jgi:hypothetical protein